VGAGALYLSLVVLLPLLAVAVKAFGGGVGEFWDEITRPQAEAALKLTIGISIVVTLINAIMGTLIAWVLVRDEFPGKRFINTLIDLPFALPTIVAGIVLLALYGPNSPLGVNIAYTRIGVTLALLFVTLPFVVRSVQPVLIGFDREMEDAARSLGASPWTTFRRVILPNLRGGMLAGCALAFGRALGEFGSIVLIAGNLPFKTEVASVYLYGQIENDNLSGAAAVSMVLLAASLFFIIVIGVLARRSEHSA
ncbi:MAG: sulfate ABC transporter permease subunit CysT, partial [Thermoleophilaceae bacterium]|nr:sulfate ABC transporter permease subunit CysT [Thermoleophilaceae bacterium]